MPPLVDPIRPFGPTAVSTGPDAPIAVLGLSARAYNAVYRAGIHTVGALAALSHAELAAARGIGPTSIAEIESQLAIHQATGFAADRHLPPTFFPPASDPLLRAVSVARLGLSHELTAQLGAVGLQMIGQLIDDLACHSQPPVVREAVDDYLAWWAEQPPADRVAEVTATGPSPLVEKRRQEPRTVAEAIDAWLAQLEARPRHIVRLRFGLDSPALTLEELGQRLGVTRERVRQIEAGALRNLRRKHHARVARPVLALATLLRHELLVHEQGWPLDECVAWLRSNDEIRLGPVEPLGMLRLLCAVDEQFILWPKHNVIALAGALPDMPTQYRTRPKVATPGVTEPGRFRPASAPKPSDKAPAPPRRLAAWPHLWLDKWSDQTTFVQFLTYANKRLAGRPTVAEWMTDLLVWAHRSPDRSVANRQTILDAAYIVGLIERVSYHRQSSQTLGPCLPADASPVELRNHCIRATLDRLDKAPDLLQAITCHVSFNLKAAQAALASDEATALNHLRLFRLLGLIDADGHLYAATPLASFFLDQTKTSWSQTEAPPRKKRRKKESQSELLLSSLKALGRPAHVSELLQRAAKLTRGTAVPKRSSALLLLLQADERAVISLGEAVFSLTEWEVARAGEAQPTLPICPRPWVDVAVFHDRLLESVVVAHRRLCQEPTLDEFMADMLAWWGVGSGARLWVRQSVMSAYYLLGVVPFVFAGDGAAPLRAEALSSDVVALRDDCQRALGQRLAAMPDCLALLQQLGPLRPKALAEAFVPLHPYGLNDVEARLHLLVGLGVAERLSSGAYRLSAGRTDAAVADSATRLRACPALLPDRSGEGHTFLESVVQANNILAGGPTVEEFLRHMIAWAGSDYPKSATYYQNVLDAYYVVGLIEQTRYAGQKWAVLRSTLPPTADIPALRDHCIRAALDRLENGRRLLDAAEQMQLFTWREIQRALDMTPDNAARHMRLFTNLGILSHGGSRYRLTTLGSGYAGGNPISYNIQFSGHKLQEHRYASLPEDGLELLAYLDGAE